MLQPSLRAQLLHGFTAVKQYLQAQVRLKSKEQNILLQFKCAFGLPLTSGIICRILNTRKEN